MPAKNLFVVCNAVDQNVFVYRLTDDKPNPIVGVAAKATKKLLETNLPVPAIAVEAIYADGSRHDVTAAASYFTLDPAIASVALRGGGTVEPIAAGNARVQVVYTDPAYGRGFADEVTIAVKDIRDEATLAGVELSFHKLTIPVGDRFSLAAGGSYTRSADRFGRAVTDEATWKSDDAAIAAVNTGVIEGLRAEVR